MTRRGAAQVKTAILGSNWPRGRFLALLAAVVALTFVVFTRTLANGFVNYDDPIYVTSNPHIQSGLSWSALAWALRSFYAANWHPVTWISHMLDVQWYGLNPSGHHLTSVLIHSLNVLLVGLILARATGQTARALITAALFGLHPIHVESVAWAAERKDVLNAFFAFATVLLYLRWIDQKTPRSGRAFFWYAAALVTFALSLASKAMSVTLPLLLLLMDYWPLARIRTRLTFRSCLLEKIPFLLLAGLTSLLTVRAQQAAGAVKDTILFPLSSRMINAAVSLIRYLGKMLWPSDLCVYYPYALPSLPVALTCVALVLAITAASLWWRRRSPALFFGWWWFCLSLMPVIGIIQIGTQAMADRYMYLPSVGILVALVWSAGDAFVALRLPRMVITGFMFLVLTGASAATLHQLAYWKNSETLFSHAVAVTDHNATAHLNLGIALADGGSLERGIAELQEAVRLAPTYPDVHLNLGMALDDGRRFEDAIREFQQALELHRDYPEAHANLGKVLEELNRLDAAASEYREALRLKPDFWDAHLNLGTALEKAGKTDEAILEYSEAIRQNANSTLAHSNLAFLLSRLGRGDEAVTEFRRVLALDPASRNSALNLAVGLFRAGRVDEAVDELQQLLKRQPDYAQAYFNLGGMLFSKGLYARALEAYQKCLALDPNVPDAKENMRKAEERLKSPSP